jgi:hypothetical protein
MNKYDRHVLDINTLMEKLTPMLTSEEINDIITIIEDRELEDKIIGRTIEKLNEKNATLRKELDNLNQTKDKLYDIIVFLSNKIKNREEVKQHDNISNETRPLKQWKVDYDNQLFPIRLMSTDGDIVHLVPGTVCNATGVPALVETLKRVQRFVE